MDGWGLFIGFLLIVAIAALVIAIVALVRTNHGHGCTGPTGDWGDCGSPGSSGSRGSCGERGPTGATGATGASAPELVLASISSNLGGGSIIQPVGGLIDWNPGTVSTVTTLFDPEGMFNGSDTMTAPVDGTYRVTSRVWAIGGSSVPFRVDMSQRVDGLVTSQLQSQSATFASDGNAVHAFHMMSNVYTVSAGTAFTVTFLPVSPFTVSLRSGFFEVAQIA